MARITVVTRKGETRIIDGESSRSLMEVLRENGFDDILALFMLIQHCQIDCRR
jgi:ferredoxin